MRHFSVLALLTLTIATVGTVPASAQSEGSNGALSIALNQVRSAARGCVAAFVIENLTGHTLDRFSVDLGIIDTDGRPADRLIFDLAPVEQGRTTIADLVLLAAPCPTIGALQLLGIPQCRAADSRARLDCTRDLSLSSQTAIPLER